MSSSRNLLLFIEPRESELKKGIPGAVLFLETVLQGQGWDVALGSS